VYTVHGHVCVLLKAVFRLLKLYLRVVIQDVYKVTSAVCLNILYVEAAGNISTGTKYLNNI